MPEGDTQPGTGTEPEGKAADRSKTQPLRQIADDLLSAFGLLSRLPLPQARNYRAAAAWSWPLVGLAVGGIATAAAAAATLLGVPPGLAAALYLATGMMATGALHEDGLADSFDGLFGGWTRERRLEIMKDSRIGSYGTLALIVSQLALWSCVTEATDSADWAALIVAPVLSRAPMAILMAVMKNARGSGLSQGVGRPSVAVAGLGALLALCLSLAVMPAPARLVAAALGVALVSGAIALIAERKIGGQTGDILGAAQQLSMIAALAALQI